MLSKNTQSLEQIQPNLRLMLIRYQANGIVKQVHYHERI